MSYIVNIEDQIKGMVVSVMGATIVNNLTFYDYNVIDERVVNLTTSAQSDLRVIATSFITMRNNTSVEGLYTETLSTSATNTVSSNTTQGYTIGAGFKSTTKISAKANVFVAELGLEQSFELSVTGEFNKSNTYTETHTETETWSGVVNVKAAPRTKVVATRIVMGGTFDIDYDFSTTIQTTRPDNYLCKVDFTRSYQPSTTNVLLSSFVNFDWPTKQPIYTLLNENQLKLTGRGKATCTAGYYTYVDFNEYPLESNLKNASPTRTYSSDVTFADGSTMPYLEAKAKGLIVS